MEKKKIAFIRPSVSPLANKIMPGVLAKAFPEYSVEVIDIKNLVHHQPLTLFQNGLAMLSEYALKMAKGHIPFREAFYTTRYIYQEIEDQVKKRIQTGEYVFSFQMQSLFDASTGLIPHFVYTDHTHLARTTYPDFDPRKMRSARWIEMERGIYRNAQLNFTWGSNIKTSLIDQYQVAPEKVVVAGVGSNIEPRELKSENACYTDKNILFAGIDWERKGGPDLLDAFQLVLQKHPDARLTIAGCSPRVNLPNCVILGKVPVNAVGTHFQHASVFCMPTRLEPFGVAFIDALYYKLPIVATRIGAIPDFVREGENGYLVEPGDVQGLARRLDGLLSDPGLCESFGTRGYDLARSTYSWDAVAAKISQSICKFL